MQRHIYKNISVKIVSLFQWTGDGRKPKRKKKVARKQTKKMAIRDSSDSSDGEDLDTTGRISEPEEGKY